jgi:hypothetical protein
VKVTGWDELKVHGCDGRTFSVIGEVREPGLELAQVQSAIHRALEDPPAAFSDSYRRGRFSSLRQLGGCPPDLCEAPASRRDLPARPSLDVLGLCFMDSLLMEPNRHVRFHPLSN